MQQFIHNIKCRWRPLFLLFTLNLAAASTLRAQSPPAIRPLTIGDTVPDIVFRHMLNYKDRTARLSDFRGKLVILDFWATWCSPCVAMIPKMAKIEDSLKKEVQFLPVAYQDTRTVEIFLDKMQKQFNVNEISVTNDTLLASLFPHNTLPHYVWINSDRKVIAVTGMEDITVSNISKALKNGSIRLPVKADKKITYDITKPLFIEANGGNGSGLVYHTSFSKYVDGLPAGLTVFDEKHGGKIIARNVTLLWLLNLAYGAGKQNFPINNQVILDVKDSSGFLNDATGREYDKWAKDHAYCYELQAPSFLHNHRYEIMRRDLENLFPDIKVSVESREAPCWLLTAIGNTNILRSKGGKPESSFSPLSCHLKNVPLSTLFKTLKVVYLQNETMPVVNGTNITGNIDMDFNANLSNIDSINAALKPYNLQFKKSVHMIPFLVITDRIPE